MSDIRGILVACVLVGMIAGCGTTKWTGTPRTATEQLLISDAMDRAVSQFDFSVLAGKEVYLDSAALRAAIDSAYLVSSLRQHMLASGCILRDDKNSAKYVVEARAGAVGTDQHDLLYGIPAINIPSAIPVTGIGIPNGTPEIPVAKKTECRAVVKIALFAYNTETGRPLWQSGIIPTQSEAKDLWILGAGPFQRGSIHDGMAFAGDRIHLPRLYDEQESSSSGGLAVADEVVFVEPGAIKEPETQLAETGPPPAETKPAEVKPAGPVQQASHTDSGDSKPAKTAPAEEAKPAPAQQQAAVKPEQKPPAAAEKDEKAPPKNEEEKGAIEEKKAGLLLLPGPDVLLDSVPKSLCPPPMLMPVPADGE